MFLKTTRQRKRPNLNRCGSVLWTRPLSVRQAGRPQKELPFPDDGATASPKTRWQLGKNLAYRPTAGGGFRMPPLQVTESSFGGLRVRQRRAEALRRSRAALLLIAVVR